MTVKEIINKANVVVYPDYLYPVEKGYVRFPDRPIEECTYRYLPKNEHHYTTQYHRTYVWPILNKILRLNYSPSDWTIVKNYVTSENNKVSDISYAVPLKECNFYVKGLEYRKKYACRFDGLMYNEKVDGMVWFTPYHVLYAFPHTSSRIINRSGGNGRTLLILGDSQMIPDITMLAYYYHEVYYIDNRNHIDIYSQIKGVSFDDVLIDLYHDHDVNYYKKFLTV